MPINYTSRTSEESRIRKPDRILVLKQMEGKKALNSSLAVDSRLFKEGDDANRLHAIMDLQTSLWSLKYEKGDVPPVLKGQYTGFRQARDHAENYFKNRNIQITEVID